MEPLQPHDLTISERDLAVLQVVARFKQLTSSHIHKLLYASVSYAPSNRALRRLTAANLLQRVERRIPGGSRGGSGQYVYQLGSRGYYLFNTGRFAPPRTVNHHTLAIADCYVTLAQLARAELLEVLGVSTEPDCWRHVGGIELKPDMLAHVRPRGRADVKLWLEIDMGTEGQRQLRGKLESYWRAYQDADEHEVFPLVVWVAIDAPRAQELAWLVSQGPRDAQALFRVTTRQTLANLFMSH